MEGGSVRTGVYHRKRAEFGHGDPTELQRRTWEIVQETDSQMEACRILGRSQGAIQSSMRGYQFAMGLTGPLPGARVYKSGVKRGTGYIAQFRTRIADLEQQLAVQLDVNAALLERIAELEVQAQPWVSVHAKLDAILARPTGMAVVTHRRVADGGKGGKKERQALRGVA